MREVVTASREGGASLNVLAGLTAGNFSAYWMGMTIVILMGISYLVSLQGLNVLMVPGTAPDHHGSVPPPTLRYFRKDDAREIEAIAERIIPSDDGPGAKEAGALYFIDGGLATFAKDQQPIFRDGLTELAKSVTSRVPAVTRFSALTAPQQDELLKSIEDTPFFRAMRFATVAGVLSLPQYGGNRGYVGWRAIGIQGGPTYAPPFGYYDRPDIRHKLLGSEDA